MKDDVKSAWLKSRQRTAVDARPEKEDPNRARATAGGDRSDCHGDTSAETASLETAKTL